MQSRRTYLAGLGAAAFAAIAVLAGSVLVDGWRGGAQASAGGTGVQRVPRTGQMPSPSPAGSSGRDHGLMGGAMGQRTMGAGMMQGGMMGGQDMGKMMGAAMANAPGPRVSPSEAEALGKTVPAGATLDPGNNRITFQTKDVHLAVLAGPEGGPDMTFRIAGLADPTIVVPQGATVTVQFVNADSDTSHGWLLSAAQPPFTSMAMMDARRAFSSSFATPLGNPTSAGMHTETISFTAAAAGRYSYLCPVVG
ncbi:MAG: hypothetical protein ACR2PL_26580, partial [Dehalococcoidia bacterium]